jgi:hypothetical protein
MTVKPSIARPADSLLVAIAFNRMRLNRGAGRYVAPEFGLFAFASGSRRNRGIDGARHRHGKEARGSLQLVDRIEPRWALRRVGGSFPAQSFDLNCRTSLSSQRPNDQGLCCSVFDEEERSFEDWHKLYITEALTSVRLKESA